MDEPEERTRSRSGAALPMAFVAIAVAVVAAAIGVAAVARPSAGPVTADAAAASMAPSSELPAASPTGPLGSIAPAVIEGGAPTVGSIAAVDADGGLSVIGRSGTALGLTHAGERTIGFPAWSPDGTRIAAVVGRDTTATIEVFEVDPATGTAREPIAVYRSSRQQPFYLSWTPSGRSLSFLANDADSVDLRVATVDPATTIDETDETSLVRRGSPLFFDWIDDQRLVAHVGVGDGAFLGELGRDGSPQGRTLAPPGDFRSPQVSADGRWVGWIRRAAGSNDGEVVVAARDGGKETTLPVFGPAAVGFAPNGDVLASIGADEPGQRDLDFPLGSLRLIDPDRGVTRTLLPGAVVASFWSPDARTILAIRIQAGGGATAAASPSPVPNEVHALFVDVATGTVAGDQVVQPGPRFVSELLPYFDQYALSHRLWAPDSSSFLLPIAADDGRPTVVALRRDGGAAPFTVQAPAAFWSP